MGIEIAKKSEAKSSKTAPVYEAVKEAIVSEANKYVEDSDKGHIKALTNDAGDKITHIGVSRDKINKAIESLEDKDAPTNASLRSLANRHKKKLAYAKKTVYLKESAYSDLFDEVEKQAFNDSEE